MLAAAANDLHQEMTRIRLLAYVILDGTLIPIDRVHDQKPYYSGKHRPHGMNVQVIADAAGPRPGVGGTSRLGTRPDCCANPQRRKTLSHADRP